MPTDDGGDDGATGTIIGGSYDCSAQVSIAPLVPSGCIEAADATELQIGTLSWVCAGGGAELSFGDFTLSGTVTSQEAMLTGSRADASGNGQTEVISASVNLTTNVGQLTYARTLGGSGAAICRATGAITVQ